MARARIDRLLVERGLFESRAKAQAAVEAGGVLADGRPVLRPSDQVEADAVLTAVPAHPWVGRAGLKLDHALALWPVAVKGAVVLDVGASTGGFTQVSLARGARRVAAVDVGRGQLHPLLRADPRVLVLEGTDARDLDLAAIGGAAPDLVVCDASFIGLSKVLPRPLSLARDGAEAVVLVKPQFEVGPAKVGRGGLVRDSDARLQALAGARAFLEGEGWRVLADAQSPVAGGDGAVEHLVWARKGRARP